MEHGLEDVQTDVRACGILVSDLAVSGMFRFGHKSFMEYLFAEVLGNLILEEENPEALAIMDACRARVADVGDLPVAMRFLAEILRGHMTQLEVTSRTQKDVALKILKVVGGGRPSDYLFARWLVYESTLSRLWWSWSRWRRVAVPLPLLSASGLVPSMLAMLMFAGGGIYSVTDAGRVVAGGMLTGMFAGVLVAIWMRWVIPAERKRRGMYVWNWLCQEVGIEDRVLYQVAGWSWVPGGWRRPFDVFLMGTIASTPSES